MTATGTTPARERGWVRTADKPTVRRKPAGKELENGPRRVMAADGGSEAVRGV